MFFEEPRSWESVERAFSPPQWGRRYSQMQNGHGTRAQRVSRKWISLVSFEGIRRRLSVNQQAGFTLKSMGENPVHPIATNVAALQPGQIQLNDFSSIP